MKKIVSTMVALGLLIPGAAWSQSHSSILPVLTGAYAPAEGGCEAAAAAFIYIEDMAIGANKTTGKVLSVKQDGGSCPSSNDLRLFGLWKIGVSGSDFGLI